MRQFIQRRRSTILFLLLYLALSIMMTWPLLRQIGRQVPVGTGGDVWVHQWTFWWLKKALLEGLNPYFTDLMFYPGGISLISHNIAWTYFAAWLPLQFIIGNNAAYSLIYLFAFALNAFVMFLMVKEWTGSTPAAFVGGLVYGFWPYALAKTGHPNEILNLWLPLALIFLRRTINEGRIRDASIAGVLIALIGLTRWQYLIMAGILIGLFLLVTLLTDQTARSGRNLLLLGLSGFVALLFAAPFAGPLVVEQITRSFGEDILIGDAARSQVDLLSYILPNERQFLWGRFVQLLPENLRFGRGQVNFLGYTVIILAVIGTVKKWRSARFWLFAAIIYILLALGPILRVGSLDFPQIPMPYRVVQDFFLVRVLREVHRFNAFLGLPLAMLAAYGVQAITERIDSSNENRKLTKYVVALLGVLIVAEYALVPYWLNEPVTPGWYEQLAQEPDDFAILDLPMRPRHFDKWYMLYQMTHEKPIVEGHVSRFSSEPFFFLDSSSYLKLLREENQMNPTQTDVTRQLETLSNANVRYLILHKELAAQEQVDKWRDWLVLTPVHEDEQLVVYRTDPQAGRDFYFTQEYDNGIGLISASLEPAEAFQSGFIQVDARWGSTESPGIDYDACISLESNAGDVLQTECHPVSYYLPTSMWNSNEIIRSSYAIQFNPDLENGSYKLTLDLVKSNVDSPSGPNIQIGVIDIIDVPEGRQPLDPDYPAAISWADQISLIGYDLIDSDGELDFVFYWQATQNIDASYKVFLHLVDRSTGEVVAQKDFVPLDWTYPTSQWSIGEIVLDTVNLPIGEMALGHYQIRVGFYDEHSGIRVPAFSADGKRFLEDAASLITIGR